MHHIVWSQLSAAPRQSTFHTTAVFPSHHTPFIPRILVEKNNFFLLHLQCLLVYPFLTFISLLSPSVNLLKPTGHVMHHQFNIQQLHTLPTLYLCVLYLSENKQRLVPLTA